MTHDERWMERYNEVMAFIETNKRNPSRYDANERGLYVNWLKLNRKQFKAGEMKSVHKEAFEKLMDLCTQYKHKNQYE